MFGDTSFPNGYRRFNETDNRFDLKDLCACRELAFEMLFEVVDDDEEEEEEGRKDVDFLANMYSERLNPPEDNSSAFNVDDEEVEVATDVADAI